MTKKLEGKKCPKFKGASTSGLTLSNDSFKNKNLIVYFYPKDSTPGCTTEGQEFGSEFLSNPETLSPIDFNPSLISDSYQHQTDMPFHEVMGADPYQAQQNPVDALA